MSTTVRMPKWGMTMEKGQVNCWLKKEGDRVEQGEALVEVESSKATQFVEAPASGFLAQILVREGQAVPIATVLAIIAAPGETISEVAPIAGPSALSTDAAPTIPSVPKEPAEVPSLSRGERARGVAASPAARRLARAHHVDLALLQGSGPDGMIVVEDVEVVLKPPSLPISRVGFYSQGHKLDGILYLPRDYQAGRRLPAIVFCLGFTYLKDLLVPEMAKRLSAQGYACLIFDYRGFGKSEGPRGRLLPLEQVADIEAAVTFVGARPEVDGSRIGLVGISLGGSHALYTAGLNEQVAVVAAIAPVGDGRRWLRQSRRSWEWLEFLERIAADKRARILEDKGTSIDAWDIVLPDPDSRAFLENVLREFPALKCELGLESAEALIRYRPELQARRISPRPMLLVHGEADLVVSIDESRGLFAQAGEPRTFVLVPGMTHFNWTIPQEKRFDDVMQILSRWLSVHFFGGPTTSVAVAKGS